MNSKQEYAMLLESLETGKQILEVNGLKIELRNCADRVAGKPDPRSSAAAAVTKESFQNKAALDPELLGNQVHLIGPENKEQIPLLVRMRQEFGWRSSDLSVGVRTTCMERPGYRLWQYEVPSAEENRPGLVFFHGGGFFGGDIPTVENQCKLLAQYMGGVVFSVDYPLAPENKYPKGFDACYDAVCWVYDHAAELGIDPKKIGVSGDSAGGNLSVICALRARNEGKNMIAYQGLIYPGVSLIESVQNPVDWNPEDYEDPGKDPLIHDQIRVIGIMAENTMKWYVDENQDTSHPYVTPILADLKGLPKTLLITAEYDFLRGQGEAFSRKLEAAGVEHRHIRYGGIFHGTFDRLGYAPQVEDIILQIAKDMKSL